LQRREEEKRKEERQAKREEKRGEATLQYCRFPYVVIFHIGLTASGLCTIITRGKRSPHKRKKKARRKRGKKEVCFRCSLTFYSELIMAAHVVAGKRMSMHIALLPTWVVKTQEERRARSGHPVVKRR
jgi:hypothetical protein